MPYYVYILANQRRTTLYVGVTGDLIRRVFVHKSKEVRGFTSRYNVDQLVHFEVYDAPITAIQREKNLKHWSRAWKIALIEDGNPEWRDLYENFGAA